MLGFAGILTGAVGTIGFATAAIVAGNAFLLIGVPVSLLVGTGILIYAVNHTD